jgi:hypothetical protein
MIARRSDLSGLRFVVVSVVDSNGSGSASGVASVVLMERLERCAASCFMRVAIRASVASREDSTLD